MSSSEDGSSESGYHSLSEYDNVGSTDDDDSTSTSDGTDSSVDNVSSGSESGEDESGGDESSGAESIEDEGSESEGSESSSCHHSSRAGSSDCKFTDDLGSSDEEFLNDFGDKYHDAYRYMLRPVRKNRTDMKVMKFSQSQFQGFSVAAWSKVGQFIGGNNHLRLLDFFHITLPNNMLEVLLEGLKQNGSLRTIRIGRTIDGSDGVASLCSFLDEKKCILRELDLSQAKLDANSLPALAASLKASGDVKSLNLRRALEVGRRDRETVRAFVCNLDWKALRSLDLSHCSIGLEGCEGLAELLQKPDCHLKSLDLRESYINEECCHILAESLEGNKRLKSLSMERCPITVDGLESFLDLLCDARSIKHTLRSNFTLDDLRWDKPISETGSKYKVETEFGVEDMLKINATSRSRLEKVFYGHFRKSSGRKAIKELIVMDVKLMPNLLSCIGKKFKRLQSDKRNLRVMYNLIRRYNVSALFGSPSAEKVRLDSKIKELQSKNEEKDVQLKELRAEKESMEEKLRLEISKLRDEIDQLKGKRPVPEHASVSCTQKRKREE